MRIIIYYGEYTTLNLLQVIIENTNLAEKEASALLKAEILHPNILGEDLLAIDNFSMEKLSIIEKYKNIADLYIGIKFQDLESVMVYFENEGNDVVLNEDFMPYCQYLKFNYGYFVNSAYYFNWYTNKPPTQLYEEQIMYQWNLTVSDIFAIANFFIRFPKNRLIGAEMLKSFDEIFKTRKSNTISVSYHQLSLIQAFCDINSPLLATIKQLIESNTSTKKIPIINFVENLWNSSIGHHIAFADNNGFIARIMGENNYSFKQLFYIKISNSNYYFSANTIPHFSNIFQHSEEERVKELSKYISSLELTVEEFLQISGAELVKEEDGDDLPF